MVDLPGLNDETKFMGASESCDRSEWVIFGAPLDITTSFRPGTRFAPAKVRQVSYGLEEYSPLQDKDLGDIEFCDIGDVEIPAGEKLGALDRIRTAADRIVSLGKRPFMIGGEHLASLPVVEVLHRKYPDLRVIQFDAHADLRDEYLGVNLSHATVMRRVSELIGPSRVYQFGIRSGTKDEFRFATQMTRFHPMEIEHPLKDSLIELRGHPLYITVDIDVIDPASAPGTGTPEPGGCHPSELMRAIYLLREVQVVGADVMEVCPPADSSDITAILAAKLIREALLAFSPERA